MANSSMMVELRNGLRSHYINLAFVHNESHFFLHIHIHMLFRVQCLAQGHFDKWTEGASDTNITGQPDLPPELQVPL